MCAKKISDYDISYAEVMLLALSNKIDIRLNNSDFNYLLDKNYFLDYLVYPNEETMSGLVSMLKEITQDKDKIFAFTLPRYSTEIRVLDKDEQVNEILSDLNIDVAIELIQSSKDLLNNITDVPDADFPYLFENVEVLGDFLTSEDDDLHLILISTIFFSTRFEWMFIFDYELEAIHFMCKEDLRKILMRNKFFQNNKYSSIEINEMIQQINNDQK